MLNGRLIDLIDPKVDFDVHEIILYIKPKKMSVMQKMFDKEITEFTAAERLSLDADHYMCVKGPSELKNIIPACFVKLYNARVD